MKVMTIVRGEVPAERSGMFEAAYLSIRAESLPPGLEISYLTRRKDSSGTYTIETVWSSSIFRRSRRLSDSRDSRNCKFCSLREDHVWRGMDLNFLFCCYCKAIKKFCIGS